VFWPLWTNKINTVVLRLYQHVVISTCSYLRLYPLVFWIKAHWNHAKYISLISMGTTVVPLLWYKRGTTVVLLLLLELLSSSHYYYKLNKGLTECHAAKVCHLEWWIRFAGSDLLLSNLLLLLLEKTICEAWVTADCWESPKMSPEISLFPA